MRAHTVVVRAWDSTGACGDETIKATVPYCGKGAERAWKGRSMAGLPFAVLQRFCSAATGFPFGQQKTRSKLPLSYPVARVFAMRIPDGDPETPRPESPHRRDVRPVPQSSSSRP